MKRTKKDELTQIKKELSTYIDDSPVSGFTFYRAFRRTQWEDRRGRQRNIHELLVFPSVEDAQREAVLNPPGQGDYWLLYPVTIMPLQWEVQSRQTGYSCKPITFYTMDEGHRLMFITREKWPIELAPVDVWKVRVFIETRRGLEIKRMEE